MAIVPLKRIRGRNEKLMGASSAAIKWIPGVLIFTAS
jgi:hypothetical protein